MCSRPRHETVSLDPDPVFSFVKDPGPLKILQVLLGVLRGSVIKTQPTTPDLPLLCLLVRPNRI